jgi:hypothetical protein
MVKWVLNFRHMPKALEPIVHAIFRESLQSLFIPKEGQQVRMFLLRHNLPEDHGNILTERAVLLPTHKPPVPL